MFMQPCRRWIEMKSISYAIITATVSLMAFSASATSARAATPAPRFRMLVIAELIDPSDPKGDEVHRPFVEAGKIWLNQLSKDSNFTVTYIESPNTLTDTLLAKVELIWQMNYTPFRWNATAKSAFEKYIDGAKGGWIGDHHASLYGSAVTGETWPWYFKFIGEINYKNYISKFASGTVRVEDSAHPVLKGVPATFPVSTEEWYIWDKSPRAKVRVLANVDETSYKFVSASESGIKMGDHPVIWTNEAYKARNLYIFMGHHPNLFQNTAYTTLIRNSIFWAANKPATTAIANADSNAGGLRTGKHLSQAVKISVRADNQVVSFSAPGEKPHDVSVLDASGRTHPLKHKGQ
jgi:uncharacterized protein